MEGTIEQGERFYVVPAKEFKQNDSSHVNEINYRLYHNIPGVHLGLNAIKEKLYFLMGDNRHHADDSRFIGLISHPNCMALFINKKSLLAVLLFIPDIIFSQTRVSVGTDISIQRSFKKDQRFWAFGQGVTIDWHFTSRDGPYALVCYYSNGNFKNQLAATAKAPTTTPQQIIFTNKAQVRLEQISLGWRHYLMGTSDAQKRWSVYGMAGFGLIFGKATNNYSTSIDTALYQSPSQPINGSGHFKRLTFDVALGCEFPIGGDFFIYSQAKAWIPTTEYPSKYLFVNNNAPFAAMISTGMRILF